MGTITKALEMLNHFSRTRAHIGLAEFVRLTGRDKATVHRHLAELEANGFLEQHPETRAYRLGPALLRLASVREATIPMRSLVAPIVRALAEDVGELAHFSLLQGRMLSPVFHHDPCVHGTRVAYDEAELLPLHATSSGLAVLAFAPPEFRRAVLSGHLPRLTPNTPTDPEVLRRILDRVRRTGTSRLEKAFDDEVASQGAPIFDASGAVIGALAVAVPVVRATPAKCEAIRRALVVAAGEITAALGGCAPEPLPGRAPPAGRPAHAGE